MNAAQLMNIRGSSAYIRRPLTQPTSPRQNSGEPPPYDAVCWPSARRFVTSLSRDRELNQKINSAWSMEAMGGVAVKTCEYSWIVLGARQSSAASVCYRM